MGSSNDNLDIIAYLCRTGLLPRAGAIADIGCQQLWDGDVDRLRAFFAEFGLCPDNGALERLAARGCFILEHLKLTGFRYRSFDIVEAPDCEYFNLNTDAVPARHRGAFDLVLNFGTTEHVMNQLNAMKALHDLTKHGGLIYSYFIRSAAMEHGLVHYSDRFVDLWMRANNYEQIWRCDPADGGCTWIVVRKTKLAEFNEIVDVQEGEGLPALVQR
jgi:SAM-dependent methyltransferase